MSASEQSLRIGDVAKLAGTTPRTIRYYEEIGLLPNAPGRPSGGHRLYTQEEVERLREVISLKELLGVTLDELKDLLTAEEARAAVRAELRREDVAPARRRELLEEALGHIDLPARTGRPPRLRACQAARGALATRASASAASCANRPTGEKDSGIPAIVARVE